MSKKDQLAYEQKAIEALQKYVQVFHFDDPDRMSLLNSIISWCQAEKKINRDNE